MAINDIFQTPPGTVVPNTWTMGGFGYGEICKLVADRYCPDAIGVARVMVSSGNMTGPSLDFVFKTSSPPERTCKAVYALRELIDDPFKQKVIEAAVPDLYAKVRSLLSTIDTSSFPTLSARVYRHDLVDLIQKENHARRNSARFEKFDYFQHPLDPTIAERKIKASDFDPTGFLGEDYPRFRGPGPR